MNWFLFAVTAPFFWAGANYIDKYLLSKFVRGSGIGSLIIFSCFFSVIALPIIFYIQPQVFAVSISSATLLILAGILNTLGVLFYLYALNEDEASIVVPLFQLTPVFGFIFAYVLIGEILLLSQFLASLLIIVGAVMLSVKVYENKFFIKKKVVFYMLTSTMFFALHGVVFKIVFGIEDFLISVFWEYVGLLITGIVFFVFIGEYRGEFIKLITTNTFPVLMLNIFNESLVLSGNILTVFAFTLAPVSLVLVIGGYQPLFVFMIGVVLSIFFPWIEKERLELKYLLYKSIAIVLIVYGGYLINSH